MCRICHFFFLNLQVVGMLRIMWCTASYRGPSLIFHSFSLEKRKRGSHPPLQLFASRSFQPMENMSAKAAINKEVFVPHDEKMLAAVQVKRRTKKKIPFLATGGQGDYMTFICLSGQGTNDHFFPSLFSSRVYLFWCVFWLCCYNSVTFQHIFLNFHLSAQTDERVNISADNKTTC